MVRDTSQDISLESLGFRHHRCSGHLWPRLVYCKVFARPQLCLNVTEIVLCHQAVTSTNSSTDYAKLTTAAIVAVQV
jgi:hypothetical protein